MAENEPRAAEETRSTRITHETHDGVTRITLNRPEKLNALDTGMLDTLERLTAQIDLDSACRTVLLDAAGDRAFCAGADIKEWGGLAPLEMWRFWIRRGHDVFERIERLLQPTIALIDGIAYGGGLELALTCDLLYATEGSRFAFPETGIAAVPGWGGTMRLAERIGVARAKQMVFTGEPISAAVAADWGLLNAVFADRTAMNDAATAVCERIAGNAPVAIAAVKQSLRTHQQSRWTGGVLESLAGGLSALTSDGAEGIASFREKRPPQYRGS